MRIEPIDLREIDKFSANIYEGIIACGKKSRIINNETNLEFKMQLDKIPKNNDDENEDINNPEQMSVSLDFEKRPKPHLQALNELLEGKLKYEYKSKTND